jgi:hypothetical protein
MCWYLVVLLFNVLLLVVLLFHVLHLVVLLFNVSCLLTVFEFHKREGNKCRCPDVNVDVRLCVCIHLPHLTCKVCRNTKHMSLKKPNCQF